MTARAPSTKRRNLALALAGSLLLFLVAQEAVLRVVFPVPEVRNLDRLRYSPITLASRDEGSATLSNASFTWTSDPDGYEFLHELNLYGFRDRNRRLEPEQGVERVLFVGDSFVEGFGTDGDNTIPSVFERLAHERGLTVEALNFGVGGAGARHYFRLVRDLAPLFGPDAVIVVFYENDLVPVDLEKLHSLPRLDPEVDDRSAPRLVHLLGELGTGHRVPRRWHAEPFSYLAAVPDRRNPWSNPGQASRLREIVDDDIAEAMRAGRFNPALAQWHLLVNESLARPIDFGPYLETLAATTRANGAELMIVYVPTKTQVTDRYAVHQSRYSRLEPESSFTAERYQRHALDLRIASEALSIPYLDLGPELRALEATSPPLYWDYDDHFRPRGYHAVARLVLDWWEQRSRQEG